MKKPEEKQTREKKMIAVKRFDVKDASINREKYSDDDDDTLRYEYNDDELHVRWQVFFLHCFQKFGYVIEMAN